MKDFDNCKNADEKIQHKSTNLSGNLIAFLLVYLAEMVNKFTFSHREHNHHLYNFHFHKNHFLYQRKQLIKRMANLI